MENIQNKNIFDRINESISQSITFKLISIGILIILLLIPQSMISDLIIERQGRMQETIKEITDMWSRSQTVSGPILTIPYKAYYESEDKKTINEVVRNVTFLPDQLIIESDIIPEKRYRGIFKVIVYKTKLRLTGKFPKPDFSAWGIEDKDILWQNAILNIGISDLRGIEQQVMINYGDQNLAFQPGISGNTLFNSGIHIPMRDHTNSFFENNFSINIDLKGSEELYFIPIGKNTEVTMTSSWSDPSFIGAFPTKESKITKDGFKATWQILHFNRNFPQSWTTDTHDINEAKFGVNLIVTADHYQKSMRREEDPSWRS